VGYGVVVLPRQREEAMNMVASPKFKFQENCCQRNGNISARPMPLNRVVDFLG
jgi:hypothetical protein